MAAETLAFTEAFDCAYLLKHDLQAILKRDLPLLMLTDSQQLFDVLTRSRYTSEKRLMVDISAAREAFEQSLISNVGLIRSEFNAADAMTKIGYNHALHELLSKKCISHPIKQFVISKKNSVCSRTLKKGV